MHFDIHESHRTHVHLPAVISSALEDLGLAGLRNYDLDITGVDPMLVERR
jgi:hypothetical protein